jgi:hypothetical protein
MWELRRRRVHSSEPSSTAPAEIVRYGLKARQARSEPFPNAAEIGREIKFLSVNARF